jgi:hypothetical protein
VEKKGLEALYEKMIGFVFLIPYVDTRLFRFGVQVALS